MSTRSSSFADNYVHSLLAVAHSHSSRKINVLSSEQDVVKLIEEEQTHEERGADVEKLESLLLQLKSPSDRDALRKVVRELHESQNSIVLDSLTAKDEGALKYAVESRIVVGIYAEALDQWLEEAIELDSEAEWWDHVGRSTSSVLSYLLATFPERLRRSLLTIADALRTQNIPFRFSSFNAQTFNQLFPNVGSFRPTALRTAFFPHLAYQPHFFSFLSPLELTRQECEKQKEKLIELRDARATQLGKLLLLKTEMEDMTTQGSGEALSRLREDIDGTIFPVHSTMGIAHSLLFQTLPSSASAHRHAFSTLCRPSRLTLLWPRLALVPIISLVGFRVVYNSRETIMQSLLELHDTVKGFWFGYVVEPVRGILDTVRTGGDESTRIVNDEAVRADLESLERMAVSLAQEKLNLTDAQIQEISAQIRQGDLTPVLKIYEEDIKSPVRKALSGSLIRSLLIQIQKAKVDLDQALSGIDKLLKSQELTFAFVGVAPSLGVVYAAFSGLRTLWSGRKGTARFGGRREREAAWVAIRRVERLLITAPDHIVEGEGEQQHQLAPVTSGLLIVALARLRDYAERRLPERSLIRQEVLTDICDLEDPTFARAEKLRVVDRMWKSFGSALGWKTLGRLH